MYSVAMSRTMLRVPTTTTLAATQTMATMKPIAAAEALQVVKENIINI